MNNTMLTSESWTGDPVDSQVPTSARRFARRSSLVHPPQGKIPAIALAANRRMQMNRINILGIACAALAFFTAGTAMADNTGTGGTITYTDAGGALVGAPVAGGYVVHTFISSDTLNIPVPASADVLVVAGGGAGGAHSGGGGGAGGIVYTPSYAVAAGSTTVTVGTGGLAKAYNGSFTPSNGGSSSFGTVSVLGGGGGAGRDYGPVGATGGSGGGGSSDKAAGSGTSGQGNAGANGLNSSPFLGGGGGGKGGPGGPAIGWETGVGGPGAEYAVFANVAGSPAGWFGGGGSGGSLNDTFPATAGSAGSGGGGVGGTGSVIATAGVANTGGGGGGGKTNQSGGNGGSGIVIVRYPYDDGSLSILLTSPTNSQSFHSTVSVPATASWVGGTAPYTVNFYLDGNSTPVSTTTSATSPLTVDLGVLALGSHTVYATVTDNTLTMDTSGTVPFSVVDNTGTGGTILYTDSSGLNPRPTTPYPGGFVVHTFTSSDTLNVPVGVTADVLMVAGGGAGGRHSGGGGGAGGIISMSSYAVAAGSTTVKVGTGGVAMPSNVRGGNSIFGSLSVLGGGGGASRDYGSASTGGSGGGGSSDRGGASGTSGQGNAGNTGYSGAPYLGGGGGGKGGAGGAASSSVTGVGGAGAEYTVFAPVAGSPAGWFGGGGSGGWLSGQGSATVGSAGLGGGGGGSGANVGTNGVANTGGGGGGGGASQSGGNGGSGIVIVRYPSDGGGGSSPYSTWANGTFTPALTAKLPTDNQDGDSLNNLQEYAFGTQPTVSTGEIVYSGGTITTPGAPKIVAAAGTYSMVFGRRADYVAAGLTYTVQFSAGLDAWVDNNDGTNPPVQVATDGTINAMSVSFVDFIDTPSGTQKPTFARVKVVQAP